MTEYRIRWEIDIEADSPREAAEQAFAIMQRQGTTANVFDVIRFPNDDDCRTVETIDLGGEPE